MPQVQGLGDRELTYSLINAHKLAAASLNSLILESVNNGLRQDAINVLNKTYQHQKMIWDYMNSKGYYQVEAAPQQEITKAQQQLQQMNLQ